MSEQLAIVGVEAGLALLQTAQQAMAQAQAMKDAQHIAQADREVVAQMLEQAAQMARAATAVHVSPVPQPTKDLLS